MKALTVQQPWAWAIIHGGKDVENRTQAWTYRGLLAIHAGARVSERGLESQLVLDSAMKVDSESPAVYSYAGRPWRHEPTVPLGGIIGVVDLVDVHRALPEGEPEHPGQPTNAACCDSPWAEQSYEEHGGKTRRELVHLVLENPRPLPTPIPATGRLGLWTPGHDLESLIRQQLLLEAP
ncbi:hypothetical protein EFK50_01140 [Nocardioides marmoriginsengisoli]|uniref:ASCH domain-containing protein n=1 Tax=Nocardioides marmoriginsengisoli TaxID=661483 RepID=A0A3N0CSL7_9ACTN|nr:hypothetical protein [Nocardioides marmoriginsengisoli]RNL66261.1 hypothetical protein EFK50_01140 [Nocardioides marmoriginsengisoli]